VKQATITLYFSPHNSPVLMKYILISIFLFPLVFFGQPKDNSVYDSLMKNHEDFSGVILIAENGEQVFQKAFGFREFTKPIPILTDDVFEMASVSKQFTAMIIMMLQEKGKLKYDDLVENFINIPYKGITIRQLLTHTSGLPDYQEIMDKHWDKTKVAGNPDIIKYLKQYAPPVLSEPGTEYKYSNTGNVLLTSI